MNKITMWIKSFLRKMFKINSPSQVLVKAEVKAEVNNPIEKINELFAKTQINYNFDSFYKYRMYVLNHYEDFVTIIKEKDQYGLDEFTKIRMLSSLIFSIYDDTWAVVEFLRKLYEIKDSLPSYYGVYLDYLDEDECLPLNPNPESDYRYVYYHCFHPIEIEDLREITNFSDEEFRKIVTELLESRLISYLKFKLISNRKLDNKQEIFQKLETKAFIERL
jgi:hypothetical protein